MRRREIPCNSSQGTRSVECSVVSSLVHVQLHNAHQDEGATPYVSVVAWQNTNDARCIPNRCAQDSKERKLGIMLAKLLGRREQSLGAKPSEVQLSPVELALVNSLPGVPFCDSSGGERAIVRHIIQEVAAFGREPKESKEPVTETEIA